MNGPKVHLQAVRKTFGDVVAVDDVDLEVRRGEFLTLLGPSGCGKTTTLMMVAGFEQPSSGQIFLDGEDVTLVPPFRREVNTVFQNYALFPHMTVFNNTAFGLRMKRLPEPEVRGRVEEYLDLVQLRGYGDRYPRQLSGGQQQRVALARAMINNPQVLLLDEPLGALDLKLRREMQVELKRLQQHLGITFIYVTHDQEEALTMSDRVAVMNHGRIEQVDSATAIYERPRSRFVAGFIGETNLLPARLVAREGEAAVLDILGLQVRVTAGDGDLPGGGDLTACIRPERIRLAGGDGDQAGAAAGRPADGVSGAGGGRGVAGRVRDHIYVGSVVKVLVTVAGLEQPIQITCPAGTAAAGVRPGDEVRLAWADRDVVVVT